MREERKRERERKRKRERKRERKRGRERERKRGKREREREGREKEKERKRGKEKMYICVNYIGAVVLTAPAKPYATLARFWACLLLMDVPSHNCNPPKPYKR